MTFVNSLLLGARAFVASVTAIGGKRGIWRKDNTTADATHLERYVKEMHAELNAKPRATFYHGYRCGNKTS
ncbi:hypothetical protein Slin14017_G123490 [Septoria linicola]|nr:hypothetical protein Slin14017_G123490 [Septoria linicola]